jgi:hypothetical protein
MSDVMDYTAAYSQEELLAHGRMRVLRIERNLHAKRFREAAESLHSELLGAIRGLDTNSVHKPLDNKRIRKLYRSLRDSERHLLAIDKQRAEVGND